MWNRPDSIFGKGRDAGGTGVLAQPWPASDCAPAPSLTRAARTAATGGHPPPEVGSAPGWPVVLYFHHVHPDIRHYTSVTPAAFDRALAQVAEQHAPLPPQMVPSVQRAGMHPEPACLLTFDDGYADVFEHALAIMERRGWQAIVFVVTDLVGKVEQHPVRGPLQHMTWEQLEEMTRRGHVVASHGSAHLPYNRLDRDAAQADIDNARSVLEQRFPGAPDWFAYPFGELPGYELRLPSLCFGSVKAAARPWSSALHEIRRTYLPADEPHRWGPCITEWRQAWAASH
jgi:peptidoglycan/xylan/chitin deacetylase (PgdA/CDA1 family)